MTAEAGHHANRVYIGQDGYLHLNGGKVFDASEVDITDTLNLSGSVTASPAELNVLDGVTAGTVTASLGVVVDSNKDIGTFRDVTLRSVILAGATGTSVLNLVDNLADALSVCIASGNDFLVFDTTDSNEKLTILGATSQKLGFYGTTPIAQRAGAAQAAVVTTAATQTTPYGFATQAQADAIVALVNELRAWAVAIGFIKGSA